MPPNVPNAIRNIFFNRYIFHLPYPVLYCTQICRIAGNIKPSTDKQKAPTNDKNSFRLGITTEIPTKKIIITKKK